jgi:hypothetical protein
MSDDYATRAAAYGFASKDDIIASADRPGVVFLDVRSEEEIAEARLETSDNQTWVNCVCTPNSCPRLEADPTQILPNKEGESKGLIRIDESWLITSTRDGAGPHMIPHAHEIEAKQIYVHCLARQNFPLHKPLLMLCHVHFF